MRRLVDTTLMIVASTVALFAIACEPAVIEGLDPGAASDGFDWPHGDAGPGAPQQPGAGPTCGGQAIPIQLKQGAVPDLHLVVDRSGSMLSSMDKAAPGAGTKWTVMQKTLGSLMDQYGGTIRFGLTLYPGAGGSCAAGDVDVPLQAGNVPTIKNQLFAAKPTGLTPTSPTLAAVRGYLAATPPGSGPRYVLLATDGMPNCATGGADAKVATLDEVHKLVGGGTKVIVVGFGEIVGGDPALLDQLALAGGQPSPGGPHKFYPATSEQELKAALFKIAGGIIPPPCTYKLSSQPPVPDKVTVKFDEQPVPRSRSLTNGWNYTGNGSEITFYGSYCSMLRQGQVKAVRFVFGCQGPVIE